MGGEREGRDEQEEEEVEKIAEIREVELAEGTVKIKISNNNGRFIAFGEE